MTFKFILCSSVGKKWYSFRVSGRHQSFSTLWVIKPYRGLDRTLRPILFRGSSITRNETFVLSTLIGSFRPLYVSYQLHPHKVSPIGIYDVKVPLSLSHVLLFDPVILLISSDPTISTSCLTIVIFYFHFMFILSIK